MNLQDLHITCSVQWNTLVMAHEDMGIKWQAESVFMVSFPKVMSYELTANEGGIFDS